MENRQSEGKHVAIIGGGVGGMVTALLLQSKGCQVTIYEKQTRLGGRLAFHEHGTLRIDQGPTVVLLPDMILSILEEAGIARDRLQLLPCDPLARIYFNDGLIFNKYRDEERQVAEIEQLFPGEGANFVQYMADLQRMYEQSKPLFLDRVFLRKRSLLSWRNLLGLWRAKAHLSVAGLAGKYFHDPRLRQAFSLQTLYIGGAPAQTPGLYSLIPYAEQAFGIWYLKGGYATLAEILSDELRARGVDIQYQAEASELTFSGTKCTGVVVNGEPREHEMVVYNGDYPLLSKLLPAGKRASSAITASNQAKYKPSSGCILVYLQANRRWQSLTTHQFYLPHDFDAQMELIFKQKKLPTRPAYYVFNPQVIDEQVAPPGKTLLYLLIPVPSAGTIDWPRAAQRLVAHVLGDLEGRALRGLRRAIEWSEIRTPQEARNFGLYDGGSFGLAPTWSQSGMFRPQVVARDVQGLYAVGASVHPGGGIPIVMQGAKLLTQHMVKEMGL